ncbi:hypothetical protein BHM03_00011815 [Ensete ventricosum]|uniref:Uncharacterized protein n=1 Tax=Ensete ventricosum TaxID=4639 RepID=A0A445MDA1_ENSVE|nr:hypothetical protein BHM03_00011815 [Ensete ventricosum]
MDLNVLRKKPRMSSGKSAPATGAESSQPEVEVIHVETSAKRPVGNGRLGPEGSECRDASSVAESLIPGESRGQPRSSLGVQLGCVAPNPGLVPLHLTLGDPHGPGSEANHADRVYDVGRLVTHMGNRASLLEAKIEKSKIEGYPEQLVVARRQVDELQADNAKLRSRLDELTSRLEQADEELNELQAGLAESQH